MNKATLFPGKPTRLFKEIASHETILGFCFADNYFGWWNLFGADRYSFESFQGSHEAGDGPCSVALRLCISRPGASLAI
jgi:hypothetical protein